jgi:curli production assembly/transport component CsgG
MSITRTLTIILLLLACCSLSACGLGPYDTSVTPATLGYETIVHKDLVRLPKPKGKIVVAVYNFRDQSGQYRFSETTSTFSTAVTQGATSMLIEALRESGWFIPVERESLNNLLTERKIIRAKMDDEAGLPRLMHAPLMLDGAIVAYETNVHTGGLGAEYTGIGASTQYRKDQVTLYLRAVNVMSGEILNSVSTSKSILSTEVRAGVFRFVEIDELLEIEAGFTTNEPPQMCVLEALEKAVLAMIVEGILDGSWDLENPEDINHPVIQAYLAERDGVANTYATEVGEKIVPQGESYEAVPGEDPELPSCPPAQGGPAIQGPDANAESGTQVSEAEKCPTAGPFMVAVAGGAVVRKEPSIRSKQIGMLPYNATVHVAASSKDWRYVVDGNGSQGYVHANLLTPVVK